MGVRVFNLTRNIFAIACIIFNRSEYFCNATCTSSDSNVAPVNLNSLSGLLGPVINQRSFYTKSYNEDMHLNITQLLTKYGYSSEQYEVETSDGYVLTMYRIPGNGPVVFLMHGLLLSSDDWVTTGPNRGLAYLLADAGYDVWLGNARGNVHSRKHVTLSPNCAEFWDFTWDEIGRYDLPAMIDFTLAVTGQLQIVYVGHSQGTTSFLVMTSEKPEYNNKISVMIALSVVAFLEYSGGLAVRTVAPVINTAYLITQAIGLYEFLPRNSLTDFVTTKFCGSPLSATVFCNNLSFIALGFDYSQINATNLPVIYDHFPAGAATKQIVHYGQLAYTTQFRRFNMGPIGNLKKYGSVAPPRYPLENVTTKIVIFYSDNDSFSKKPDRQRLISRLPNVVEYYRVPFAKFYHLDYLYAKDLKYLLNDKVLDFIEQYR